MEELALSPGPRPGPAAVNYLTMNRGLLSLVDLLSSSLGYGNLNHIRAPLKQKGENRMLKNPRILGSALASLFAASLLVVGAVGASGQEAYTSVNETINNQTDLCNCGGVPPPAGREGDPEV